MSELVGRFLSFEEDLGDGLVKFVYYVLLFLLIVTSLYDWVMAFFHIFAGKPWSSLGLFLVGVPLRFMLGLLLLRVGAEVILAILSIDDSLKKSEPDGDTMSSGLNLGTVPASASTKTPAEVVEDDEEPTARPRTKKATKKSAKKTAKKAAKKSSKKAATEAATEEAARSPDEPANTNEASPPADLPKDDNPN